MLRTSAAPVIAPRTNLPSLPNAFVGRATALRHVGDYLTMPECRLLTLVGAPGVGKTRLGIRAAEQVLPMFPDGVFFVGLAAISDPALVAYAIADAVGIRQRGEAPIADVLNDHLAAKRCLLVLDNFEHVLAAAPGVGDLLACAPGVKVLATSREPLELYGEHEYVVSPLALPNLEQQTDLDALSQNEAVRLFVQRAQAAASDFRLTRENAHAVAEICTRLDGLPLAIELAAARVKVYAPDALLALLDQRLTVLTSTIRNLPARHRTLHSAIEWSYSLLDDAERTFFRRLGAFAGGWTLDSAEAVYSVGLVELAKKLEALCNKSLAQPMTGSYGEQRFTMLETLREYALRKLVESGEETVVRDALAAFFLKLVEQADAELRATDQPRWLRYLEADQENLRAVMKWLLDNGDLAALQRLGVHLVAFWHEKGYLAEGRYWLERTLAAQGEVDTRARTEEALFSLAWAQGDYAAAHRHASEHLKLARALGDEKAIAEALYSLGGVALAVGDYATAHAHYQESRTLYYRPKKPWSTSFALTGIGEVAYLQGDYASARQYYEEDLAHARETGSQQAISAALNGLAKVTDMQGDFPAAQVYAEESLLLAEQAGNQQGIAIAGNRLGRIARQTGDYARARVLHEKSLLIARSISSAPIIAYTLNKLGELALDQEDREAATRLHTEALQLNREMNDPYYVADSLCCLAVVKTKQGQLSVAHQYLTEALEIAWKIRASAILLHVFACFACWYAMMERFDRALEVSAS
ncbi:MAG: tetratricopeptide repeat protein [Anaerolineae bacterium]